jgi:50S ribosomal protein L16 3-hydroxylase
MRLISSQPAEAQSGRNRTGAGGPRIEVDALGALPLGMPPAQFLRDYWQKHPLLIRNAFPNFISSLSPEDLAGLACEEAALSRLVMRDRKKDQWSLRNGPFAEAEFPKLPDRDWTLLVQDVDKWDADVRELLSAFDFLPRWRLDDVMVSFAAPGGSVGAHVDHYDVFLLQAQGRRRWQISVDLDAPREFRDDAELKLLRTFDPTHEWSLEPGDMLYLPPGVPHHGVAEDACLTFSIGMRAPSQAELLVDFAEHLAERIPDEVRYADPDLVLPADSCEIDAAVLARVRSALGALRCDDEAEFADWFGRYITTYRSTSIAAPRRAPGNDAVRAALLRDGGLLRHPFARMAWTRNGKSACLFANGESFAMPIAAARMLAAAEGIDASAFAALPVAAQDALLAMTARGIYRLQRVSKRGRR